MIINWNNNDTKFVIKKLIIYLLIAFSMFIIGIFNAKAEVINDYYNSYNDNNFYVCETQNCSINTTSNNPFKNKTGKLTFTIYQAPESAGVEMINEINVSDNTGTPTTCNLGSVLFYNDNNTQRVVTTAVCDVNFSSNGWRNITIHRRGGGKLFLLFSEYATLSNNGDNANISSQLTSIYNRLSGGFSDLYNMQYQQYVTINGHLIDIYNKIVQNNTSITQSINNNTQAINDVNNSINNDNVTTSDADDFSNNQAFSDSTGLESVIELPLNMVNSLTSTCEPIQVTIPFIDYTGEIPCMSTIYKSKFNTLYTIVKIVINGFFVYRLLLKVYELVHDAKQPDEDKLEVIDL